MGDSPGGVIPDLSLSHKENRLKKPAQRMVPALLRDEKPRAPLRTKAEPDNFKRLAEEEGWSI